MKKQVESKYVFCILRSIHIFSDGMSLHKLHQIYNFFGLYSHLNALENNIALEIHYFELGSFIPSQYT